MDLLVTHFNALTFLFAGAICVIVGVCFWVKGEVLFGVVMCIVFGANFIAQGFLDLTKLSVPGWVGPSIEAVCGVGLIWQSISKLHAAPSPSPRRRTWWWILAFGIGAILLAIYHALQYYWH
jgi:hypothetical protein